MKIHTTHLGLQGISQMLPQDKLQTQHAKAGEHSLVLEKKQSIVSGPARMMGPMSCFAGLSFGISVLAKYMRAAPA